MLWMRVGAISLILPSMLKSIRREPEVCLRTVDLEQHPHPDQLESFMNHNLPPSEARKIIRHLLKGCPVCTRVTRELWKLGERAPRRGRAESAS